MQKQIVGYIGKLFFPYLCGSRKSFSKQQALLALIENWKKVLDKKGFAGAVLMDLSKAFDSNNHAVLIAKVHAHVFNNENLKLFYSYLNNYSCHRNKN